MYGVHRTDGGGWILPAGRHGIKVFRHDRHDRSASRPTPCTPSPWTRRSGLGRDQRRRPRARDRRCFVAAVDPFDVFSGEGLPSDTMNGCSSMAMVAWARIAAGLMRLDPTRRGQDLHVADEAAGEESTAKAYFACTTAGFASATRVASTFRSLASHQAIAAPLLASPMECRSSARLRVDRRVLAAPARPARLSRRHRLAGRRRARSPPRPTTSPTGSPGLTDRWIDLGAQHRITLTDLDSGNHVLEVRRRPFRPCGARRCALRCIAPCALEIASA